MTGAADSSFRFRKSKWFEGIRMPPQEKYQNLENEKRWHEATFYVDLKHWTSHPFFCTRLRHWTKCSTDKIRFYSFLCGYIKKKSHAHCAKVLLAPVGNGFDAEYLQGVSGEVHGIDISPLALANCPGTIIKREGDILSSGYANDFFDIICCVNFLHHIPDAGMESILSEYARILKKGGMLAILEPSSFYPVRWLLKLLNKTLGNVTGKVEGERPISPLKITRTLKKTGFEKLRLRGISYNHARFPYAVQLVFNLLDFPLRVLPPFSMMAESIGVFSEKA